MDMDSKKEEEYALVYIAVGTLNYSYQLDVMAVFQMLEAYQ